MTGHEELAREGRKEEERSGAREAQLAGLEGGE
jgi:hypothetical protein